MPRPAKVRLGEILIQQRLLNQQQLQFALEQQKRNGRKLGHIFVENKFVTEEQISRALSKQLGIPYVDLKFFNVKPELVRLLPESQARRFRSLVLEQRNDGLLVGMAFPTDLFACDELARLLKVNIELAIVNEEELLQTIDRIYRRTDEITGLARELEAELGDRVVDFGMLNASANRSG